MNAVGVIVALFPTTTSGAVGDTVKLPVSGPVMTTAGFDFDWAAPIPIWAVQYGACADPALVAVSEHVAVPIVPT